MAAAACARDRARTDDTKAGFAHPLTALAAAVRRAAFPGIVVTTSTGTGEVQRRLAAGERDFQGASLSGVNLRGANLIGTNLRG